VKRRNQHSRRSTTREQSRAIGSVVLALATSTALALGCLGTSPPVEYYTLEPRASEPLGEATGIAVGVGAVQLPSYLDRQQIVTRAQGSQIRYAEYHRWAGVLSSEIPRTIAENLRILLGSDRVAAYPTAAPFPLDYRVVLDIERFDAAQAGDAVLNARWSLRRADQSEPIAIGRSDLQTTVASSSYADLAAAHSELLAELAREIAARIALLHARPVEAEIGPS
jgi:uncharacterized lipoprotein YmbA